MGNSHKLKLTNKEKKKLAKLEKRNLQKSEKLSTAKVEKKKKTTDIKKKTTDIAEYTTVKDQAKNATVSAVPFLCSTCNMQFDTNRVKQIHFAKYH